jgi:REP element-mobilizing transposase RayT
VGILPRKPRLPSESGMYHIMTRGNEQKDIFRDDEDKSVLINILHQKRMKTNTAFSAICIMNNHLHLLGKFDPLSDLSTYMNKVNTSYASYYNKKFMRIGHVFQDRYKSEAIKNEQQFLACVRYIHNNPVKAEIVQKPGEYRWSSFTDYTSIPGMFHDLVDTQPVLSIFSLKNETALKEFKQYSSNKNLDTFMDYQEIGSPINKSILTCSQANQFLLNFLHQMKLDLTDLHKFEHIKKRKHLIQQLKEKSNLSIRQIAELLNINKNSVTKAL